MRALEYHANDDVRVVERDRPRPGPGEIVVAVRACGICASDVLEWYMRPRAPLFPGHEVVGVVAEVDPGVTALRPGDRVFVHHHVPCMVCRACRRGATTSCERFRATRLDPGGLAAYVRVPAEIVSLDVLKLPEHLDDATATFVEPLACVVRSVRRGRVEPGDSAIVVGGGLTGLLHVQTLVARGAARVLVVEPRVERRTLALALGADTSFAPDDAALHAEQADAVFVTPPDPRVIAASLDRVAPGGTLVVFGPTGPGETFPLEPYRRFFHEVSITSTYSADPRDTRDALQLLVDGRVRVEPLITLRVPLAEAQVAFAKTATHREVLKAIVTMDAPA